MRTTTTARTVLTVTATAMAAVAAAVAATAGAQTKAPQQVVKPPVAQAWIDVATFTGFGMPAGGGAGANPMAMAGSLFGGGAADQKNVFARTGESGSAGTWVDVALFTSRNPGLMEAQQAVPPGMQLQTLKLITQKPDPAGRITGEESVVERPYERPKGKLYLYWGCGETVRAGQPLVLDVATAAPDAIAKFFTARRATQRGAHNMPERPHWPNEQDARMVPANASLVGEHAFSGQGVPENFRFKLGAQQDIMPPVDLRQTPGPGGATLLEWAALPTARGYFAAAMGATGRGGGDAVEMAFWSSSEVAEIGMGLVEFQTNPAVDRWLKEKVLLEPSVTRCAVPGGIFGQGGGAFLRMIAYGSELNLAHPPRPADPKIAWEPEWAVKVRVKSVASAILGMDMPAMQRGVAAPPPSRSADAPASAEANKEPTSPMDEIKKEGVNVLRGIFGR